MTARRLALSAVALTTAVVLGACTGDSGPSKPSSSESSSGSGSATPSASASSPAVAAPPPAPGARACYQLSYDQAVAPTADAGPVPCAGPHTSATYDVGTLDAVVGGHLLAVDSQHVRDQVAARCPQRFAAAVGGTQEDRALSMLRPVWFTPTVEDSDAGATWYRCDAVALAGDKRLAPLIGPIRGALDRERSRTRYAMCGTAAPGTRGFERVICSAKHSWRAVSTVPFEGERYPGARKVRAAGDEPCRAAGAAAANGALDYKWGYEWPTAAQWAAGHHYGICWVPSGG